MNNQHENNWDQLLGYVPKLMEQHAVPGVAAGILHNDQVLTAGFGVTNVDHPLPVTGETLFQVGSITKTFTATVMMRLVEMGKLDLDAPVQTYLPDFKVADETASARVTIRHLLTHTSGWFGDLFLDTGPGADAMAKYAADMVTLEQLSPLGDIWSYNNAAFYLAGHIIEVVTSQSYEIVLKELLLDPLGLENTFFDPGDVITYRFAVGHEDGDDGPEVARPWPLPRAAYPAGGITCSVPDLLTYARFHMGKGTTAGGDQLLTPESMSQMQSTQATIWKDKRCGLSWFLDDVAGTHLVSHGGGTMGQVSELILVPDQNFAVAIFTNADRGGFVTDEVTRWVLDHYLDVKIPKPEPIETTVEELAAFTGRYSNPFRDTELGIINGKLIFQTVFKQGFPSKESPPAPAPPPMSLTLCEKDCLLVLDGPYKGSTIHIGRKQDGSIAWLRQGLRIAIRQG